MKAPTKKLDKEWRIKVIEKYGEKCEICGSININVHHIVGRANRATRWYIPNGCVLCPTHHTFGRLSAHQNPLWFRKMIVERRGLKWEKDLMNKSNEIWNKKYEVCG